MHRLAISAVSPYLGQVVRARCFWRPGRLGQGRVEIERPSDHGQFAITGQWPGFGGCIPVELDAVPIRVAQAKGMTDAVIRRAVKRDASKQQVRRLH